MQHVSSKTDVTNVQIVCEVDIELQVETLVLEVLTTLNRLHMPLLAYKLSRSQQPWAELLDAQKL